MLCLFLLVVMSKGKADESKPPSEMRQDSRALGISSQHLESLTGLHAARPQLHFVSKLFYSDLRLQCPFAGESDAAWFCVGARK